MSDVSSKNLKKLRVLHYLKEGQTLTTANNTFNIYSPGIISWLFRKFNNDNKNNVISTLEELYHMVEYMTEHLIADYKTNKDDMKKIKIMDQIIRLAERINLSFIGLENLCKTYKEYPDTIASIEGIIQDSALVSYKQLINTIPDNRLTDLLRENIRFGTTNYQILEGNVIASQINIHNNVNNHNNTQIHFQNNELLDD